jgi:SnoaL-like domain
VIEMGLTVEDKFEIQELEARYARATDMGDGWRRAATFLPDGAFEGSAGRLIGREAIAKQTLDDWSLEEPNRYGARRGETQHWIHNIVVAEDSDGATADAYFALLQRTDDGARTLLLGHHHDILRKVGGRWFFAEKVFEPWPTHEVMERIGKSRQSEED